MSTDALSLPDDPAALKALLRQERELHVQTVAELSQTIQQQQ